MKKLLLLPLLLFAPLFALPLGNPMDASLYTNSLFWGDCYGNPCDPCYGFMNSWSFRVGFYGDYVFNRHMELESGGQGEIDDFRLSTNAAFLAINICDRFDAFGTVGTSHLSFNGNPRKFGLLAASRLNLDSNTAFSWSAGGRVTLWDWDCFYLGLEGQYFATKPDIKLVEINGIALAYPDNNEWVKYTEWQIGFGASYLYRVACSGISVIPYTGFKWARARADFNNSVPTAGITLFNQKNSKSWGWALGTTLLFCDALSLTAEGRWGDEKALYINGQIRF